MTLKVLACQVDGVNSEESVEDLDAALALAKAKRDQRHHRVEILDGDLTTHRWDRTHVIGENRWRKVNPGEMRLLGPVPAIVRVARRQVAVSGDGGLARLIEPYRSENAEALVAGRNIKACR